MCVQHLQGCRFSFQSSRGHVFPPFSRLRCGSWLVGMKACTNTRPFHIRLCMGQKGKQKQTKLLSENVYCLSKTFFGIRHKWSAYTIVHRCSWWVYVSRPCACHEIRELSRKRLSSVIWKGLAWVQDFILTKQKPHQPFPDKTIHCSRQLCDHIFWGENYILDLWVTVSCPHTFGNTLNLLLISAFVFL